MDAPWAGGCREEPSQQPKPFLPSQSPTAVVFVTRSGAGTSGGELEDESWRPPDPELIHKLVAQIEFYLSDENLEHDAFLLKHVRRNKLGFVSVKLLTSFKKVTATVCDQGPGARAPTP